MEKSKLVILLRSLGSWELRNIREMVASPYFNKQKLVSELYQFIEKCLKKGQEVPEMEDVFKKLIPNKAYDHQKLRYIMTDLTRIVEEYFIQKELSANSNLQGRLLLQAYSNRKQEKYFSTILEKNFGRLETESYRDSEYFFERLKTNELAFGFESERKERTGQDWLHPMLEDLQIFFQGSRLRLVCELVSQSNGNLADRDKELVNELRKKLGKSHGAEFPAIAIYETVLAMLSNADPELYYRKLRMQLRSIGKHFRKEELKELYAYALSYSITNLNSGKSDYLREIFTLYQEQLDGKILYEDDVLPLQHFKNIATVGLRLKEFEWTRKFISEKSSDLPESSREGALVYNNAALFFVSGDFGKCRNLLEKAVFKDVFYSLDANSLLLKSLYELGEFQEVIIHCNKFLAIISESLEISEKAGIPYSNLATLTRRLAEIKLGSRNPLGALIGEIQAAREVSDLKWLRGKVDEANR